MSIKITSNPNILSGKPIIGETRIAVSTILDMLATGMSKEEILEEYPMLTMEQINAAISFASKRLDNEVILPVHHKGESIVFSVI